MRKAACLLIIKSIRQDYMQWPLSHSLVPTIFLISSLYPAIAYADFTGQVVGVMDRDSLRVMHHGKAEQVC